MTSRHPHRQVDVVIAAYQASDTIARAVRSALAQPEVARVVVVDDASADATASAARAAGGGDERLLVERSAANLGPSSARNLALARCDSPWVTVLDADDRLLAGRFATMLKHADEADLIADDLLVVHADDTARATPMFLPPVTATTPLDARRFIAGNIGHRSRSRRDLGFIKPLLRRSALDALSDGFRPDMRLGEDYELYARLLLRGARGVLIQAAGYVYTIAPGSLSGTHGIEALERFRDADLALAALEGLSSADRAMIRRHYRSVDARLQWRTLIDAVKTRNAPAATGTFLRSPTVTRFLVGQLTQQLYARTTKRLRRAIGKNEGA